MTRLEKLYQLIEVVDSDTIDINEWYKCFAGIACAHLEFEALGLFLNDEGVPAFSANNDNYEGFEALAVFFGLLPREAFYLFAGASYERCTGDILPYVDYKDMFLSRLSSLIQQRKDNHGHAPAS